MRRRSRRHRGAPSAVGKTFTSRPCSSFFSSCPSLTFLLLLPPPPLSFPTSNNKKNSSPTADSITCSLLGAQLRSGPCGGLQDTFKNYAAKYANADCATIDAAKAELQKSEPSLACCQQLRQFASNGCTCDRVTATLASAVLGGGGDTRAAIAGGVRLAQASRCSLPENGGPITDTCTGSTGCPRKE